jgi:hypothetical protein
VRLSLPIGGAAFAERRCNGVGAPAIGACLKQAAGPSRAKEAGVRSVYSGSTVLVPNGFNRSDASDRIAPASA